MNTFAMASRYLTRSWHRSLINIATMALASGVMIFYVSLMEGLLTQAEERVIAMELAHVQLHAQNYRTDPDLYNYMVDIEPLLSELVSQQVSTSSRLFATGLGASEKTSSGIQLWGVDLRGEPTVTQLHANLLEGKWLEQSKPNEVVIGKQLAKILDLDIGDELIVLGQAFDGAMANELLIVRGILKSVGRELDRTSVLMSQQSFRALFSFPQGAHEIAIRDQNSERSLMELKALVTEASGEFEVASWREIQPFIADIIDTSRGSIYLLVIIAYTAVAMVILNAMLMSVFERIREFGVLKALGLSPMQLLKLIFLETILQVSVAAVIGVAVAVPITLYYAQVGIDLSRFSQEFDWGGVTMSPIWHPSLSQHALVSPIVILFLISFLAVIYPAIKAASIVPIKAIYMRD